jgi:hypothetical protein
MLDVGGRGPSVDHCLSATRLTRAPDFTRLPHLSMDGYSEVITPYYRQCVQVRDVHRVSLEIDRFPSRTNTCLDRHPSITYNSQSLAYIQRKRYCHFDFSGRAFEENHKNTIQTATT